MLVLTQKVGDATLIGADIEVQVLHISPTQVRLGFVAPKNMNILRGKLKETLLAAGKEVYTEKPEKSL